MLTERLKRMTEQALPVRVRIHFVVIDDGYYIHFDGSEAACCQRTRRHSRCTSHEAMWQDHAR